MNSSNVKLRIFYLSVFLFGFFIGVAGATPPSAINLTYDLDNQKLHFDITHVSRELPQHRIRKVVIYINDQEYKTLRYVTQTNGAHLIDDLTVNAKPGDSIRVVAVCSDSGRGEQTLIVPAPEKDKTQSETPAQPAVQLPNNTQSNSSPPTNY